MILHWQIYLLDASKAIQQNNTPIKIIKANHDFFSEFNIHNFKEGISTTRFFHILKRSDVKSTFRKKSRIDKENYQPVSILRVIFEIFEKLTFRGIVK